VTPVKRAERTEDSLLQGKRVEVYGIREEVLRR